MPYKEAIKKKLESNATSPIKKSKYKIVNWSVYNKSLRNRRFLDCKKLLTKICTCSIICTYKLT